MGSVVNESSELVNKITCPTPVPKTLHDRYFTHEHFDRYYESLHCEKKLVEINDVQIYLRLIQGIMYLLYHFDLP